MEYPEVICMHDGMSYWYVNYHPKTRSGNGLSGGFGGWPDTGDGCGSPGMELHAANDWEYRPYG